MGFKAEQFVKSVDEHLFCSICHDIFEDPVSCKDGHTFCKDCIHEWLKSHKKCPLDNGSLTKKQLVRVLMAKGIIDNLEVYCQPCTQDKTNEVKDFEERCDWVGKLQHVTQHRKTCPFQEVKCPHEKCSQTMQRRELEHHKKKCDFRYVECEKCDLLLYQRDKEKHIRDDCLMALISCPYQCKDDKMQLTEIKRIDLADHLSNICPKAQVDCPYKEQGCEVKVERQDVDKHVQENMAVHMLLLAKECSLLRKQNTSLTDQCSSLAQTNVELKEQCSSLVRKNALLNKELIQIKGEFHDELLSTCSYTWTVNDYPNLSKNHPNGSCISSPTFWLCGYRWHIVLCPNGNTKDDTGFLSLFLQKVEDDSQALCYPISICNNESAISFRLSVISQKPGTCNVLRHCKHVFTNYSSGLGCPQFMKASNALSPSYCKNGNLIIKCTILPDNH